MSKSLIETFKPQRWDDIVGQPLVVEVLKGIVNKKGIAPRSIILQGPYGSGKTSAAHIFAKAINKLSEDDELGFQHLSVLHPGDYRSKSEKYFIDRLHYPGFSGLGAIGVVLFEEIHTMNHALQNILLSQIDYELEGSNNIRFFIFNTTEIEKVIDPLRSRSLELVFELVNYETILKHLDEVEIKLKLSKPIPDSVKNYIAHSSKGHMRNAHMQLNRFLFLDESSYKEMQISVDLLCDFFLAIRTNKRDQVIMVLNKLCSLTLMNLNYTFEEFILLCHQFSSGYEVSYSKVGEIIKIYGDDIHKLYKLYFSEMFSFFFRSERNFQSGMLSFYQLLSTDK